MILITGATGHIGNILVKKLYKSGKKIRIFVLPNEDLSMFKGMNLEVYYGDIRDYNAVNKACKSINKIFHLAAVISLLPLKNKLVYSINVGGVENVIKAIKENNIEKLLYVSSVHAFSEIEKGATIDENTPIDPNKTTGAYGKSKAIATLKVLNAINNNEINATIIFPTGIIGPFDYKNSEITKVFKNYLNNEIKIFIDGAFDFVDVRDIVDGIIKASEKDNEKYILSGENLSMRIIFHYLNIITGKNIKIKYISELNSYIISYFSLFSYLTKMKKSLYLSPYSVHTLHKYYKFSHKKAQKDLDYNPRSLYETIKDTISWICKY
ncbi:MULTISPECIES: NAD-dependent epimerase/dehydratase family protein [unclassified Marinitoga]|uniref:NAD-dependent epimerase/dehydratase family protein n=1 Tax=unclassified Marinitoga TaxID=2640159 RepID=UPI000641295F|nr:MULTISPECIES: NAD-dependent epimerase/dehydratase family protein [unclassified Marinitoga]KLO22476.1 hypothetical protein X274_08230 [Marinitoga sp. 1155]NUV00268.1 hypothetical protein [Marinitoga sp. 1154]